MNPNPGCKSCSLSQCRKRMVESRGTIPADVLFLMEAPSVADELMGHMLAGQEGKILISLMTAAAELAGRKFSFHVAGLTFCRPASSSRSETRPPRSFEILSCMKNVMKVYTAVGPKLTVLVGALAKENYASELPESVYIQAPWLILKQPARYNTNVRTLAEALKKYVPRK